MAKQNMTDRGKDQPPKEGNDDRPGRIGRLDEQTLGYYRRVSETLKDGFEGDDGKDIFLNNVFGQLSNEALAVSRNQTVSNIVESLIHEATGKHIKNLFNAFAEDWETAITDRFASHVVQSMLEKAAYLHNISENSDSEDSEDEGNGELQNSKTIKELTISLFNHMMSSLPVYMQHTYASHIVRVLLEVLAGTKCSESVIRSKMSRKGMKGPKDTSSFSKPPPEFKKLLEEMTNHILKFKKLEEHVQNYLSNPVLQTLLLVLRSRSPKLCTQASESFIESTQMLELETEEDADKLPVIICHEIGSHFVEQLIEVADDESYQLIFTQLKKKLLLLALDPVGNYVLQRLITHARTEKQFKSIFKKISKHIEDVFAVNHLGVIVKLAEGCIKHGICQEKLLKVLMKAFHCYKPLERQSKCFPLMAALTTYEVFYKIPESDDEKEDNDDDESDIEESVAVEIPMLKTINLHGSILLQQLLKFGNPKLLISSMFDMRAAELKTLSCDPCGSHVIDAFLQSKAVGEKSVDSLINKLKGTYTELACHKNGSRTLDNIWSRATLKQKGVIAEEVSKSANKIQGDRFGRFAWRNYGLHHYIHRRNEWRDIQTGNMKKRKMFQEILGTSEPGAKKKKQKMSTDHSTQKDSKLHEEENATAEFVHNVLTGNSKTKEDGSIGEAYNKKKNKKTKHGKNQKSHEN